MTSGHLKQCEHAIELSGFGGMTQGMNIREE